MDFTFNLSSLLNLVPTALLGFFWWYIKDRNALIDKLKEESATKEEVKAVCEEKQVAHKEIWQEVNGIKERLVRVETKQERV